MLQARMKDQHENHSPRDEAQAERLDLTAMKMLRSSGYYALRNVSCELDGNVLRLGGTVPTYYEKQVAQSVLLQGLEGKVILQNHLEVASAPAGS